jgi:methylated-DNA-[protein]-cysteine S-methyltransferase
MSTRVLQSPFGTLTVHANARGLTAIDFGEGIEQPGEGDAHLEQAVRELSAFFKRPDAPFTVPLAPEGTPFQKAVWNLLREIPAGATWTYGELAAKLGKPGGSRAVGAANGANPIPIIVPCHRVVGTNGKLTGYAGGMEMKRALLRHEGKLALVLRP